jgi:bifunctional oligoribonuclease and PAP phosphatase NrnA
MNESQTISEIVRAVRAGRRFLVITHVKPDGDAVGSVLALTFMLRKLGKEADAFCADPLPVGYDFLAGAEDIRNRVVDPSFYDVAVTVDCGDFQRVGDELAEAVARIPLLINIDHHVGESSFGQISWVQPSASSACEMLYRLCSPLGVPLDPDIATQLYTGILTDTGSFRFSNTNRDVLEIAATLVASGAQPSVIAQYVYDSGQPQRLRLLARVLATVTFHADDRLATAELSQKMLTETGTSHLDSEGFINELRSVRPVMLAMLFREGENGTVHVSMRSKGDVDVARFAQKYGGGGHRLAAAFHVSGGLDAVRSTFTSEALSYIS